MNKTDKEMVIVWDASAATQTCKKSSLIQSKLPDRRSEGWAGGSFLLGFKASLEKWGSDSEVKPRTRRKMIIIKKKKEPGCFKAMSSFSQAHTPLQHMKRLIWHFYDSVENTDPSPAFVLPYCGGLTTNPHTASSLMTLNRKLRHGGPRGGDMMS